MFLTRQQWLVGAPLSLVVLGVTAIAVTLSEQRPACGCGVDTHGRQLSTIQRMQQAAHTETGAFLKGEAIAQQLGHIKMADIGKHHTYQTALISSDAKIASSTKIAIAYATPHQAYFQPQIGPIKGRRQPMFYGAVSAIAFNPADAAYPTIICQSAQPTDQPLAAPEYKLGQFTCPDNAIRPK